MAAFDICLNAENGRCVAVSELAPDGSMPLDPFNACLMIPLIRYAVLQLACVQTLSGQGCRNNSAEIPEALQCGWISLGKT